MTFFGKDESTPTKSQSEEEFNINIDEKDKKYAIRGFIDKLFLYKKKKLSGDTGLQEQQASF